MVRRFRSWWLKITQHPAMATTIIVAFLAVAIFIFAAYKFGWNWTGFNGGYGQETTHTATKDTVMPPTKTLWDWLQLLIIPLVLAVGGLWFSQIQKDRELKAAELRVQTEREAAENRAQTEREIALDNQREVALQTYINKISELLLKEGLRDSTGEDEVRVIARNLTLTMLPRLDGTRKSSVLLFLHESGLIEKGKYIIDLSKANLSGANLRTDNLRGARLVGTDLRDADIRKANLKDADLSEAKLNGAILDGADLRDVIGIINEELENQAKSLKGATMPDGSIHP